MSFDADVGGVTCAVTLDTGSSINVIHKSVFDVLPKAPPLFTTATVAHTVSKDPLPLIGRTQIAVKVAGEVVVVPFYVSDQIDCTVLLGLEFFGVCPCVLDLTTHTLVLAPSAAVRSISASCTSVGAVTVQRDIVVPPGRELLFPGFLRSQDFTGPALLVPTAELPGLEFVNSMVHIRGQSVPCVVRNVTTHPITIPKKSELGQLEVGVAECTSVPSGELDPDWLDKVDLSDANLTEEQAGKVKSLLTQYSEMFDGRLGFTKVVEHEVDTGDSPPVRSAPRRVPPFLEGKVKAELQRMVELGILEESDGFWSSPICVVAKRDGRVRICADLRRVNAVTKMPAYPIPRIDSILDSLSGSSVFCVLDLRQCFYQIGVAESSRDKTTIATKWGNWRHTRVPMGLSGSPATCAKMLDIVLKDVPAETAVSFFDDICVHGSDFDDVLQKLETVLERLHRAGLTINLSKCALFCPSVKFLGHVVSSEGLTVDPDRVSKVRDWPVPRTAKQLSSFLGLAGYMRKFVKNFSGIAAPLFKLLQKDVQFQWSEEAQSAFMLLKKALCETPVLTLPDFSPEAGQFILETDCSDQQAGAVLLQMQNGVERVIAYGSQKLSKAQVNYSTTKKELLAVIIFCDKFSAYLLGKQFTIRSDHSALRWLLSFRNPHGMLARWFEILSQFHFRIEHRPGAQHVVPDALSRRPTETVDQACQTEGPQDDRCFRLSAKDWSGSYFRSEQDKDVCIGEVTKFLSAGVKPRKRDLSQPCHRYLSQWSRLRLLDGVLYRVYRRRPFDSDQLQIVLPESLVQGVLQSFHAGPTGGHFAADKLLAQVRLRFWWSTMCADVERFCKSCPQCGERNTPVPAPRASLGEISASEPLEVVGLDILSSLPETASGHKHILLVVDHFSRWVEAYPLKTQEATEVASVFVKEFVSRFGCPKRVHSDQGGCFVGEVMRLTCEMLGIDRSKTTSFHPQSNSIVERTNRTLLGMFSKFLENHQHAEWDRNLPLLLLGLRSQVHRSLGVSPFCVMFGREPRLPVQVEIGEPSRGRTKSITEYIDELRSNLRALHSVALDKSRASHLENKRIYDRKMNDFNFQPGDKVYLHKGVVPKGAYYKFLRPWKPAVVVDKVGALNYRIRVLGAKSTLLVHHNRLKPRVDTGEGESPVTAPTASVPRADPAARPQPADRTAGRRRMDGVSDSQRVSGAQCEGRPSCQPADAAIPADESGAPVLSWLNPFALSFTPRTTPAQAETARETGETPARAAEPVAGLAPAAEVPHEGTAEPHSPELRRSTRVVHPPDRYSP